MPVFNTPEPITATLELVLGDVRITAADRADTVVEVRPSDPAAPADVQAAEQTHVGYAAGRLLVKAPRPRALGLFGKPGSIDVHLQLPTGSTLYGEASLAAFAGTGTLGEVRIKTAIGNLRLDRTGPVELTTSTGDVSVHAVTGNATAGTSAGTVRFDAVEGTLTVRNANGDCRLGTVTGDVTVRNSTGDVLIARAGAGVNARTARGNVRVGAATRGVVSLKSSFGKLEVGVPTGTATYLDLHTQFGNVRNRLDTAAEPTPGEDTLEVHARTAYGDIVIGRPAPEEAR